MLLLLLLRMLLRYFEMMVVVVVVVVVALTERVGAPVQVELVLADGHVPNIFGQGLRLAEPNYHADRSS